MKIQTIKANDITVGYQTLGKGYPLVLIMGYGGTMDLWDTRLLKTLTAAYRVIIFDNRGMGYSSASEKDFSIKLFAADTAALLKALKIDKAHILGYSMGAQIALELAVQYPALVGKLILYAGSCGGENAPVAAPEVVLTLTDTSGTPAERSEKLIPLFLPEKWRQKNPDFIKALPIPNEITLPEMVDRQTKAFLGWEGCFEKLPDIFQPTLIITGTEDVIIPPENSLILAERIPSATLGQISGGGHGVMYQYPEKLSQCILEFLGSADKKR